MKLYVIMGHRHERYDGEHAPEAIECWDEHSRNDNPDGFLDSLENAKAQKDFAAVTIITLRVGTADVMAALYPKNELKAELVSE